LYTFNSERIRRKGNRMMEISKTNPSEEMSKTGRGNFLKEVHVP